MSLLGQWTCYEKKKPKVAWGRALSTPVLFGSDFVSLFLIKKLQTFLKVKIDNNWVNLTSCQAHWVLWKMPLGGAKAEHFSCFHSSCQLGLSKNNVNSLHDHKVLVFKLVIKNWTDFGRIGIGNYTTKDRLNRTCMSRTKTRRGWNFFMDYQTSAKRYV